jgi:hypothetical protein
MTQFPSGITILSISKRNFTLFYMSARHANELQHFSGTNFGFEINKLKLVAIKAKH